MEGNLRKKTLVRHLNLGLRSCVAIERTQESLGSSLSSDFQTVRLWVDPLTYLAASVSFSEK